MSYRKETYHIRFFDLIKDVENSIGSALPGAKAKSRRAKDILVFDLPDKIDLNPLCARLN